MNPLERYPVLSTLLRPFRRSQQKTCAAIVTALCQAAQAGSFAVAGQLSCLTEVQLGSALTRLYRFLRNDRFDNRLLTEVWLCDRGFHRVKWPEKFVEFEQQFVVRLTRDVTVRLPDRVCLLKNLELQPGGRRDFGFVWLRSDELVGVRLIGVRAQGAKEAWWLATNLPNAVSRVVSYYDRRMGIEEQFRDAKGQQLRDEALPEKSKPSPLVEPERLEKHTIAVVGQDFSGKAYVSPMMIDVWRLALSERELKKV